MLVGPPVVAVVCWLVHLGLLLNGGVLAALSSAALQRRETAQLSSCLGVKSRHNRHVHVRMQMLMSHQSVILHEILTKKYRKQKYKCNTSVFFCCQFSQIYQPCGSGVMVWAAFWMQIPRWDSDVHWCCCYSSSVTIRSCRRMMVNCPHTRICTHSWELKTCYFLHTSTFGKALDWCYHLCSILICPSCEVGGWMDYLGKKVLTIRFRQICQ